MTANPSITAAPALHEALFQRLAQAHQNQQLSPVLLLHGPQGIGKTQLAQRLAIWLLTGEDQEMADDATFFHPDFLTIAPLEKTHVISVDQIRELQAALSQTPHGGKLRVTCIAPAESLNPAACNALLKTLEEPGTHNALILISHHLERLLPTLKSRCHHVSVPVPSVDESMTWLKAQRPEVTAKTWAALMYHAFDQPTTALAMHDQADLKTYRSTLKDALAVLEAPATHAHTLFALCDKNPEILIQCGKRLLVDAMRHHAGQHHPCCTDAITHWAQQCTPAALSKAWQQWLAIEMRLTTQPGLDRSLQLTSCWIQVAMMLNTPTGSHTAPTVNRSTAHATD